MKSSIKPATVHRTADFKETKFGISSNEDLVYIFDILRNKLYSDKIIAVIREYCTNAMDAHVELGKEDLPILVTLPTAFSPEFRVRDYGEGLSEQDIREVYCMYGRSTKRNSNDFTGQLGLGSKSGFSYGDNFMVVSYRGNKKTTYNAYIDETRLGSIAKLSEEDISPSETGIEIIIPVKSSDVREFSRKAGKTLRNFVVTPKIINGSEVNLEKSKIILEGKGWRHVDDPSENYYRRTSYAVMGNIGYPVDTSSINFTDEEKHISDMLRAGFEIDFGIGELNIGANRESLEYDKYTQINIKKRCEEIISDIKKKMEDQIKSSTGLIEALKKAEKLVFRGRLSSIFGKDYVEWNGITLKSEHLHLDNNARFDKSKCDTVQIATFTKNGTKVKRSVSNSMYINSKSEFILRDTGDGWVIRVKHYLKGREDIDTVFMLTGDMGQIKDWLKEKGLRTDEFIKLSTLEKPKLIRVSNGTAKVSNRSTGFTLSKNLSRWGTQSDNWNSVEIDKKGKGVYVKLLRFEASIKGRIVNATDLKEDIIKPLKSLGYDESKTPIYGIKVCNIDKLGDGWIELEDFIMTVINKDNKLKNKIVDVLSKRSARDARGGRMFFTKRVSRIILKNHTNEIIKGSAFSEYISISKSIIDIVDNLQSDKEQAICSLDRYLHLKDTLSVDVVDYYKKLTEAIDKCKQEYPITSAIDSGSQYQHFNDKEVIKDVLNYIKYKEQ